MIKDTNFHLYRLYPATVIWKKATTEDNYMNIEVQLFIHQTMYMFLKLGVKKKNYFTKFSFNRDI